MKRSAALSIGMVLAALAWLCTGCGGISGSHSVSPASFFLPGLIYHEVPEPRPDDAAPAPVAEPDSKPLPS